MEWAWIDFDAAMLTVPSPDMKRKKKQKINGRPHLISLARQALTLLREIRIYNDTEGRSPFEQWLDDLKDVQGRARIRARLARLAVGNFSDCKPLRDGVQELRIDHGSGYRVYLSRQGPVLVLLLCGSDKNEQEKASRLAVQYLADWKQRGET